MSTGLIALLDDVVGLAKVAAASIDDAVGQAGRAGVKAAGIVVDDAAVTPRYAVGFAAEREIPIIARIAAGSLKNKLLFLLPAALLLSFLAPWMITPLLMAGGLYLCFEGAEKIWELVAHHDARSPQDQHAPAAGNAVDLENAKIKSAIRTDFILSAEIMAITLSTVAAETGSYWSQAVVLAVVGVGITFLVYGAVALIVKADDAGLALARNLRPASSLLGIRKLGDGAPSRADRLTAMASRPLGRALVMGMPGFLKLLGAVGTAAMLWVGGGILVHGLAQFGQTALEHLIHDASTIVGHTVPAVASGAAEWATGAAAAGLLGLAIGLAMIPLVNLATGLVARMRSRPKT